MDLQWILTQALKISLLTSQLYMVQYLNTDIDGQSRELSSHCKLSQILRIYHWCVTTKYLSAICQASKM